MEQAFDTEQLVPLMLVNLHIVCGLADKIGSPFFSYLACFGSCKELRLKLGYLEETLLIRDCKRGLKFRVY